MRTTSTWVDSGAFWVALTDCLSTVAVQALPSTATARTYTLRMDPLPLCGTVGVKYQAIPKVKENPQEDLRGPPETIRPALCRSTCQPTLASFACFRRPSVPAT